MVSILSFLELEHSVVCITKQHQKILFDRQCCKPMMDSFNKIKWKYILSYTKLILCSVEQ